MESMRNTQMQEVMNLFVKMSPEGQNMVMALTKTLAQQQKLEKAEQYRSARKAMEYARINMIKEAEMVMGKKIMRTYRNCPEALAGFGFVAGIAEGKRMERARRRTSK